VSLYDAFISYSHAKDKPIAAALQRAVQTLGKPWYQRRALRVFRDDTSLSATPHLWPTIEQALGQSRFLILLASPEATASQWVNKEVAYWLEHKSADTLLIAVTDGTLLWDNALNDFVPDERTPLPPALKGRFAAEPKWVDLAAYREGADKRDARFTELAADFAAAIRGMPKEDLLSQEVKQQRKALRLAWSAATFLLLLAVAAAGATVVAYWQQQRALRSEQQAIVERDKATRNFKLAHGTADSLVFNIAQGLRDQQGMRAESVRKILDAAKATFEQLATAAPDNLDIQRSREAMLTEFGSTYLTMGDLQSARQAFEAGLATAERLARIDPANTLWQLDLSISYESIGDVQLAAGQRAEALASYRKCLAIRRALVDSDKSNTLWQLDLAIVDQKIGDALMGAGQRAEALASYRTGLAIVQRLADNEPGNARWQRELATFYDRIGNALVTSGQREEALAAYQKSLAIREALAGVDKGNTLWQRDLAVSYNKIGDVLVAAGRRVEALAEYQKALAIGQALADADRGNTVWQRDLTVSYSEIGDVLVMAASARRRWRPIGKASPFGRGLPTATRVMRNGNTICRSPTIGSAMCW